MDNCPLMDLIGLPFVFFAAIYVLLRSIASEGGVSVQVMFSSQQLSSRCHRQEEKQRVRVTGPIYEFTKENESRL